MLETIALGLKLELGTPSQAETKISAHTTRVVVAMTTDLQVLGIVAPTTAT